MIGGSEHGPLQACLRDDHGRAPGPPSTVPQVPARRRPRGFGLADGQDDLRGAALTRPRRRLPAGPAPLPASPKALEVRFVADARVDDGRFVNNGWLQECPDPITKISWDNAILVSPRLAKELGSSPPRDGLKQVARKDLAEFDKGRENAHVVELTVGGRKIGAGAHPARPRQLHGRRAARLRADEDGAGGRGDGLQRLRRPGVDGAPCRDRRHDRRSPARKMFLADSQWHWSMEGRDLVREGNLAEYQENPAFAKEVGLEAESPRPSSTRTWRDDAGRAREPDPARQLALQDPELRRRPPVGDEHRPKHVHRLQRLRRRVPGREQHPDRRQGPGAEGPHHALDPARPVLLRRQGRRRAPSAARATRRSPRIPRSRCSRSPACSASWPRARRCAR